MSRSYWYNLTDATKSYRYYVVLLLALFTRYVRGLIWHNLIGQNVNKFGGKLGAHGTYTITVSTVVEAAMDLASEMNAKQHEDISKPSFEDITETSGKFCRFLLDCTDKLDTNNGEAHSAIFMAEFSAVALPVGALTPFTDFTGQHERRTVIFSGCLARSLKLESTLGESVTEASDMEADESITKEPNTLSTSAFKVVKIGQLLSQKRVFLTKSEPLYSHPSRNTVASDITALNTHDPNIVFIPLNKARYLCSLYTLGSRKALCPLPDMWVLCESHSSQKIVALGCSVDHSRSTLHVFTITEEDCISMTVTPGSDVQKVGSGVEKQAKVKRRSLGRQSGQVFSEYEIGAGASDATASAVQSQLVLQFAWSDPEMLLNAPHESADAVLRIAATPGCIFSPVLPVYLELTTLLNLCNIAYGQAQWPTLEDSPDPTHSLAFLVANFLEEAAQPLSQPAEVTVISPTADQTVYERRKDFDFAERLWMFAKEVQTLDDLKQIFASVFKALLLGELQPFLHRSGSSLLVSLFRQVLLCTTPDERQALAHKFQALLSESKILNCLVQLGVEKLKRDYRSFFIGSDLATGDQLDHFFGSDSNLREQCNMLCKLHNVLELASSALTFLKLPTGTLSSLTKVALEVYRRESFESFTTTPVFCLPIPAYSAALKSVASLCANLAPRLWTLSACDNTSAQGHGLGTSMTVMRSDPLFQTLSTVPADSDSGAGYYVYKGRCDFSLM